jgi:hypothetical protein
VFHATSRELESFVEGRDWDWRQRREASSLETDKLRNKVQ